MSCTLERGKSRRRGLHLIIGGIITCVIGYFVGTRVIPNAIFKRTAEKICVDSPDHAKYSSWVGSLNSFDKNKLMKITYWNITNRNGFLYEGQRPVVKEVGPYIYQFSSWKRQVSFSDKDNTVSYKSLTKTKFDAAATKAACPACSESDKITTVNGAYIGTMMHSGGDKNFAYGVIPGIVQQLLTMANSYTGSENVTMKRFGSFNDTIFPKSHTLLPTGWLPAGFGPWFSKQNNTAGSKLKGSLKKLNRTEFNISETRAIYNVVSSPIKLGTTSNQTLRAQCTTNTTILGCGYLFYLNVYNTRRQSGFNVSADPIAKAVFANIQKLFCSDDNACITVCPILFKAICEYIIDHLAKLAIHLAIDSIDFGPVMTRSVKQLTHGFTETRLKIPGFAPAGLPVAGYLPNDSPSDLPKKKHSQFFTCKSTSRPFAWAGYDGSHLVKPSNFPAASIRFRKVRGYHTMFGMSNSLASCTNRQPPTNELYTVFDSTLKLKATIKRKGTLEIGDLHTHKYMLDTEDLLKRNNMSVFVDGLIDKSAMGKSIPIIASMPHFLAADPAFIKNFNTKPDAKKHSTVFAIEPITGAAMKVCRRSQINLALPEKMVEAPRQKPFNITYKEKNMATHFTKVIPVFWLSVDVTASQASTDSLAKIYPVINGACASLIVGPLIGGFMVFTGIIFLVHSSKFPIHSEKSAEINAKN